MECSNNTQNIERFKYMCKKNNTKHNNNPHQTSVNIQRAHLWYIIVSAIHVTLSLTKLYNADLFTNVKFHSP